MFSPNPASAEIEAREVQSLFQRARGGDAAAFGEICRNYENRLVRQAMALCGNECLAEELAHDTLVEAWKSLSRYNGRCQPFTWFCAILLNRFRNSLREKRPIPAAMLCGREKDQFEDCVVNALDRAPLPDQEVQNREQAAQIWGCIEALPFKQQQVIYLRFYVDNSLEGIAAALDCSVGTVKSRLFNALENLRSMKALAVRSEERRTL